MRLVSEDQGLGLDTALAAPVLVIDGDPVRRHLTTLLLKRLGYPPAATADTPAQAVDLLRSGKQYDALLLALDAELDGPPAVEGLQAALRAFPTPFPRLFVVAGEAALPLREPAVQAGAAGLLTRPLTREALASALSAPGRAASGADADFDASTWSELQRVFGAAGVRELTAVLCACLPEQQRRLAAAVAASDLQALRHLAHALRGSSLQFGAAALAELCGRAEAAALAGQLAPALSLCDDAMRRHAALVGQLRSQLGRLPQA